MESKSRTQIMLLILLFTLSPLVYAGQAENQVQKALVKLNTFNGVNSANTQAGSSLLDPSADPNLNMELNGVLSTPHSKKLTTGNRKAPSPQNTNSAQ